MNFQICCESIDLTKYYTPKFKQFIENPAMHLIFNDEFRHVVESSDVRMSCFNLKGFTDIERMLLANMFTFNTPVSVLTKEEFMRKHSINNSNMLAYCIKFDSFTSTSTKVSAQDYMSIIDDCYIVDWGLDWRKIPYYAIVSKDEALRDSKGKFSNMHYGVFHLNNLDSIAEDSIVINNEIFSDEIYNVLRKDFDFDTYGVLNAPRLRHLIKHTANYYVCDTSKIFLFDKNNNANVFVYSAISDRLLLFRYLNDNNYSNYSEVRTIKGYHPFLPDCLYDNKTHMERLKSDAVLLDSDGSYSNNDFSIDDFMTRVDSSFSIREGFIIEHPRQHREYILELSRNEEYIIIKFNTAKTQYHGFSIGKLENYEKLRVK